MGLSGEANIHDVETSRILSSESAHYILVQGKDIDSQSSQDESTAEELEDAQDGGYLREDFEVQPLQTGGEGTDSSDFMENENNIIVTSEHHNIISEKDSKLGEMNSILQDGNTTEICTKQRKNSEQLTPPVLSSSVESKPLIDVDTLIPPASAPEQESENSDEIINIDVESIQTTSKEAEKLTTKSLEKTGSQPKEENSVKSLTELSEISAISSNPFYSVDVHQSPPGVDEEESEREDNSPNSDWEGDREIDSLFSLPLSEAQSRLEQEVIELERERARQGRAAAAVSNLMYKESQVCLLVNLIKFMIHVHCRGFRNTPS